MVIYSESHMFAVNKFVKLCINVTAGVCYLVSVQSVFFVFKRMASKVQKIMQQSQPAKSETAHPTELQADFRQLTTTR